MFAQLSALMPSRACRALAPTVALIAVSCGLPAHAEERFFEPMPVVLSASRLPQPLSDTPAAMTVIDAAGVEVPTTWDEWVEAARKVSKATQTPAALAWDRSGHRFAGPAISYGAKIFDAKGDLVLFEAMGGGFTWGAVLARY